MHVLGIDIGKATFDVALTQDNRRYEPAQFTNDTEGMAQLVEWLNAHQAQDLHVCMEATGRYGEHLALRLYEDGYQVSVVNPMQIHAYGKSKLRRNKNDRLDAQLIADFCWTQHPSLWIPCSEVRREAQEISRHIDTLMTDLQRKKNQLSSGITSPRLKASMEKTIHFLDEEIRLLEQELLDLFTQDAQSREDLELLVSIPGIGQRTACRFLAEVDVSLFAQAPQLAAYAGLTPTEHSSGTSVRKKSRLSKAGNRRLRTLFFMPALSAHRFNPIIASFRARLLAGGKAKMCVVGAVMRKLLHLAYGVLKTRKPFDPNHVQSIPVGG